MVHLDMNDKQFYALLKNISALRYRLLFMASKGSSSKTKLFVLGFVVSAGAMVGMQCLPTYASILQTVNLFGLAIAFFGGLMILKAWWF